MQLRKSQLVFSSLQLLYNYSIASVRCNRWCRDEPKVSITTGVFTQGSVTVSCVTHCTLVTNNACLLRCHLGMRQDVDGRATKASDSGSPACCPRAVYFLLIPFDTKELQSAVAPKDSEIEKNFYCAAERI